MRRLLPILIVTVFASSAHATTAVSAIRRVDFRNFTFPGIWEKQVTLRNGKSTAKSKYCETEYELGDIAYADLNRDGREDAVVPVRDFQMCGSSCQSHDVYIYTIKNNRPSLLWKFVSGCSGFGGLKEFHVTDSLLVLELFGKTRIAGTRTKSVDFNDGGAKCCPKFYSVICLSWIGHAFRQRSLRFFPFGYASISDYYSQRARK
jgi:hypothetical protein